MEPYTIVLLISTIIFAGSSVLFLYLAATTKKTLYSYALLVSLINLISSMVMMDGQLVGMSADGEPLMYTRWLGYIASCTLLAYSLANIAKVEKKYYLRLMYLTGLTMLTGALASVATGGLMIGYFLIGGLTYALMLVILRGKSARGLGWVGKYITWGWSVFPVVFLLSPEGFGIIGVTAAAVVYLGLDIFTKIMFYFEYARRS